MSGRAPDDCRDLGPLLGRVTDGEATPDEALRVARHLSDCTSCRIVLARENRLAAILERGMEDTIPVDDSFVDEVMARVPSSPPPRPRRRSGRRNLKLASIGGMFLGLSWLILNASAAGEVDGATWSLTPRIAPPETGGFAEGATQIGGLLMMAMDSISAGMTFNSAGAHLGLLALLVLTIAAPVGLAASAGAVWMWINPTPKP